MSKECDTLLVMQCVNDLFCVSPPHWVYEPFFRLDIYCVAKHCEPDKRYYARLYCGAEYISVEELRNGNHTASERHCLFFAAERAIDNWCSPLPFDADIVLTEGWNELARVTITLPPKP